MLAWQPSKPLTTLPEDLLHQVCTVQYHDSVRDLRDASAAVYGIMKAKGLRDFVRTEREIRTERVSKSGVHPYYLRRFLDLLPLNAMPHHCYILLWQYTQLLELAKCRCAAASMAPVSTKSLALSLNETTSELIRWFRNYSFYAKYQLAASLAMVCRVTRNHVASLLLGDKYVPYRCLIGSSGPYAPFEHAPYSYPLGLRDLNDFLHYPILIDTIQQLALWKWEGPPAWLPDCVKSSRGHWGLLQEFPNGQLSDTNLDATLDWSYAQAGQYWLECGSDGTQDFYSRDLLRVRMLCQSENKDESLEATFHWHQNTWLWPVTPQELHNWQFSSRQAISNIRKSRRQRRYNERCRRALARGCHCCVPMTARFLDEEELAKVDFACLGDLIPAPL